MRVASLSSLEGRTPRSAGCLNCRRRCHRLTEFDVSRFLRGGVWDVRFRVTRRDRGISKGLSGGSDVDDRAR